MSEAAATASNGRYTAPLDLSKFALLSIAAAVVTIVLKTASWWVTGSVGLLADAAESLVNLVAAVVAFIALKVAIKPADENHPYGHSKAEYFSAAVEGLMIFVAAAFIIVQSVERLLSPKPLEQIGLGLLISVVASLVNGGVSLVLLNKGRTHRSTTLMADGKHLMTDVVTSAGVLVGVGLVAVTGQIRLDPIVALLVGANILWTGISLIKHAVDGLMDVGLPSEISARIDAVLDSFRSDDIGFHAIRTREAGNRRFLSLHVLVPDNWSVKQGHDLTEDVIDALLEEVPDLRVSAHLEPKDDPRSYEDEEI